MNTEPWILRFEGSSDDTFGECGGLSNVDDDDCGARSLRVFRVKHESGTLLVAGQYTPRIWERGEYPEPHPLGNWLVGVLPDNDAPWPPWRIWHEASRAEYTPALCIEIQGGEEPTVEFVGAGKGER